MKGKFRGKWLKAICFIMAGVSMAVTLCASIVFAVCICNGFTVTKDFKISGDDRSFREQALYNLAEQERNIVLNEMYDSLLYNNVWDYSQYVKSYSKENSNYFFEIRPVDDSLPVMINYYERDYQYKNTENIQKTYYESEMFVYPYSLSKIVEEWRKKYKEEYGSKKEAALSDDEIIADMSIRAWRDDTIYAEAMYVELNIDLSSDSGFMEMKKEFEREYMSKEYSLRISDIQYDMQNEQLICDYEVSGIIDLEYTEYVRSELTAKDVFYNSLFLKYGDIIEKHTVKALIGGGLALIASSILLFILAGRRDAKGNVVCGRAEKIPLEILIIIPVILAVLLASSLYGIGENQGFFILTEAVLICIIMIMYSVILSSMAVRIKAGMFIKSTLCYKVFSLIKRCTSYLWENIHIYGKALGVYGAIVIIKSFFVGLISDYTMEAGSWIFMLTADLILAAFLVVAVVNMNRLKKGAAEIANGNTEYKIDTSHMMAEFKEHGETLNRIGDGIQAAVEEQLKSERMKTELITNVSHDIKTPITSIISYVDLLDKENIENEKAKEYIEVLKRQSERLKKLVQDLIDASKASTGNIPVNMEQVNINVMLEQLLGESMEKLSSRNLTPVVKYGSEGAIASGDGRLLQRCFDNLIQNIYKYAMDGSRVYIDVKEEGSEISVTLKNISKVELNISGDELMERFVRGDSSRNTEGSGLGLSIAKSLMEIQNGDLKVDIDGDLFKATVVMKRQL